MPHIARYLRPHIERDLTEKMVFVGGPRQVGKTTLALDLLKTDDPLDPRYFNWDNESVRKSLQRGELNLRAGLAVFDEIHKAKNWKSLIKGYYDTYRKKVRILVTGSARLDHFRRGGDSLQGRYFYYRLHPLTLSEISNRPAKSDLDHLLRYGGFPEPFVKASESALMRWHKNRLERIVYGDIRDLYTLRDVARIELLADELPRRVGAPLSIKNLKEDLSVAHETMEHWISILESIYFCFRIPPFGAPRIRAVKKEQKMYLWDWSMVENPGYRLENMVASHLLKYCHFLEDTEGHKMELRFLRDTDGREVDFVVLKNKKPEFAVECKTGEREVSRATRYFRERTSIPKFYQVHTGTKEYGDEASGTRVLPFIKFVKELALP